MSGQETAIQKNFQVNIICVVRLVSEQSQIQYTLLDPGESTTAGS